MKRALPLLALLSPLVCAPALAAGPVLSYDIYVPTVDTAAGSASPDGITLDFRYPLTVSQNVWIAGNLVTSLSDDKKVKLGTSLGVSVGVENEFAHHISGFAYLGYGKAAIDTAAGSMDAMGVNWGLGLDFLLNTHLVANVGYTSLFDGNMDTAAGVSTPVSIAGPRAGLGYQF